LYLQPILLVLQLILLLFLAILLIMQPIFAVTAAHLAAPAESSPAA
jgi:hypothetical protein